MTGRSASKQGGYQMAGVMVGICLALVGGVVAGKNKTGVPNVSLFRVIENHRKNFFAFY